MSPAWSTHSGTWSHTVHRILPPAKTGLQSRGNVYFGHLSASAAEVRPSSSSQEEERCSDSLDRGDADVPERKDYCTAVEL